MINSSHKIRFYWLSLIVLLVTACGDNNENAVLEASKQHERDRQSGWLVGYIDYTRSDKQPTLLSAIDRGYNLIIIASASINADGEVSIAPILDKKYALKKQIKKAQQKGIKVLVSLGNENNIFNPIAMTAPESVAKNIFATLLVEFGFDGIDLNLENNLQWNSKQVVQMIDALKHLQKNVVITGSPEATIVIGRDQHAVLFSPQALWNGAEGLVASGKFDYILLEAYNQRDGISIDIDGVTYNEKTPGIFAAIYDFYRQKVDDLNIPSVLIVGEPASPKAGIGLAADAVADDIICLKTGQLCHYQPSRLYPDMPGVMTWSIGWDDRNHWRFADAIRRALDR